jgi:DNA-binding CsgD family transcriptional regulator
MVEQSGIIVSSQVISRLGMRTLLGVVGGNYRLLEFDNLKDANEFLKFNACNFIVLFDDIMPHSILGFFERIRKSYPKCKVLYIGNRIHIRNNYIRVIDSRRDQSFVSREINEFLSAELTDSLWPEEDHLSLSEREVEVLKLVALGNSNKIIADTLCISVNTVISHRKNITEKLGIKTISGLTVYAIMNKLIATEDVKDSLKSL